MTNKLTSQNYEQTLAAIVFTVGSAIDATPDQKEAAIVTGLQTCAEALTASYEFLQTNVDFQTKDAAMQAFQQALLELKKQQEAQALQETVMQQVFLTQNKIVKQKRQSPMALFAETYADYFQKTEAGWVFEAPKPANQ